MIIFPCTFTISILIYQPNLGSSHFYWNRTPLKPARMLAGRGGRLEFSASVGSTLCSGWTKDEAWLGRVSFLRSIPLINLPPTSIFWFCLEVEELPERLVSICCSACCGEFYKTHCQMTNDSVYNYQNIEWKRNQGFLFCTGQKLTTRLSRSFFRSKIFFFPESIVNAIPGRELSMTEAALEFAWL